jgi:hypothetical protein
MVLKMNLDEFSKEKLWQMLVDAVHASVMFPTHKAYTRDTILPSKADVSAFELSQRLSMPLGEAIVILEELADAKKSPT